MSKVFEDEFSALQADMVSICLEYVDDVADKIYIYCSAEDGWITGDFFYQINGKVVQCHRLNEVLLPGQAEYDVSGDRQDAVLDVISEDIAKLQAVCKKYNRPMPTEMKLVYNVKTDAFDAEYKYEAQYADDPEKTADDIVDEWFDKVKRVEER